MAFKIQGVTDFRFSRKMSLTTSLPYRIPRWDSVSSRRFVRIRYCKNTMVMLPVSISVTAFLTRS